MEIEGAPRCAELQRRELVMQLQDELLALREVGDVVLFGDVGVAPVAVEDFPIRHHFAPYTYAREMEMPAGSIVVGHRHRVSHVAVLSQGKVAVYTEFDGAVVLTAPCTFVSRPGTKRVLCALEDSVLTTVHSVSMPAPGIGDLDRIRSEVIREESGGSE